MLVGHEVPRVFTPPKRELTPETSLGYDVIRFATDVLGVTLLPWERWLLIHALEILGDFDGEWHLRFRTVVVLVARQNGKTLVTTVLTLYFLYMLMAPLVMGVAQELDQAEEAWQAAVDAIQSRSDLNREVRSVKHGNSGKRLNLSGGRRYITKAANRKAGRGKRAPLVIIDELREQTTWDCWNAVSDTILAQLLGLLWCTSNAGDALSVVLRRLRFQAHQALGDPDGWCAQIGDSMELVDEDTDLPEDDTLGLFEWSARPERDLWDREGMCEANPSLGYGFLTERALIGSMRRKKERDARTENLCQFVEAIAQPPFPVGAWEAGMDEASEIAPDSPLYFAMDVSDDRTRSSIAVCGMRADRTWHVELVAYRAGISWLVDWFQERADPERPTLVAYQSRGAPVTSIADAVGAVHGVELVPVEGPNIAAWSGRLWDAVAALDPARTSRIMAGETDVAGSDSVPAYHRPQPALDMAANVAVTRPLGDGSWAWDRRRSPEDVSPLVAVSWAYGLATDVPEAEPEQASAYDEYDLMIV